MEKILITGASGMVGSHTLRHLLKNTDNEFIAICGWQHKGEPDNLAFAIGDHKERVTVITHDLSTPFTPRTIAKIGKIDGIINIASESHVDRSIVEPIDFIQNNVNLTLYLLEHARTQPIRYFLQFSTDEVYGAAEKGINHAEWSPIIPSNPYSASKACQEAIAISYWRTYNLPVVITNTMNVFSERQDWEKFIPLCVNKILKQETIDIHAYPGAKEAGSRFYIHADSVAEAVLFILNKPVALYPNATVPDRYNIVGDKEMNNLELAQSIASHLNKILYYKLTDFHSERPGHDARYALDGTKLKQLGWQPTQNFDQKLKEVVVSLEKRWHENTTY